VAQIPLLNAVSRIPYKNRRQRADFLTGFMAPQGTRGVNHGGSVDIFDAVVQLMQESMIDL
jgi:alpha-acetolactate decarboxylase